MDHHSSVSSHFVVLLWSLLLSCLNITMLVALWSCANKGGMLFSCEEIYVFTSHRLQKAVGVLLFVAIVLFYG